MSRESRNESSGRVTATLKQKEAMFEWLRGIATGDSKDWRKAAIAINELNDYAELRRVPPSPAAAAPPTEAALTTRLRDALSGMVGLVQLVQERYPDFPVDNHRVIEALSVLKATE